MSSSGSSDDGTTATVSTLSAGDQEQALEDLLGALSDTDALRVWRLLGPRQIGRVLKQFDGVSQLPRDLSDALDKQRAAARAAKQRAVEARAASEGQRLCALVPAFADLGPRVRVYCSVRGAVRSSDDYENGYASDSEYAGDGRRYRVRLTIKYDDKVVVRFKHTDVWMVYLHDNRYVKFEYDCAEDKGCAVCVPEGVPLSAHDWRVAARTYLRAATQYYAVSGWRHRSTWGTTESDDASEAATANRKRSHSPDSERASKRSRASTE